MPKTYMNELEDCTFDVILELYDTVQDIMPSDSMIQTVLMASYQQLTPQEKVQIVEQLGPEWFVKLSTKIERRLRGLTY